MRRGKPSSSDDSLQRRNPNEGLKMVRFGGDLMPPVFENYMRYHEFWKDTTAAGATYMHYRMNSIFDPYYQAGGAGVGGIDFMQSIYMRYDVIDSQIEVTFKNDGTEPVMIYLYPIATTIPAPALATSASAPYVKTVLLPFGTSAKPLTLRNFCRLTDILGPKAATDMDTGATAGANPAKCAYWCSYFKNIGGSALALYIDVTVRYHVRWSDRQPAAASNQDG